MNTALKHEEKDYECTILSKACPFNNKKFIQKIELGQQKPKEFMDEIMETVILDLNKPLKSNKIMIIHTSQYNSQKQYISIEFCESLSNQICDCTY